MTAIITKFLGPTNLRGSRYKARAGNGAASLTVDADDRLGIEANHYAVARALIVKLGWFHDSARGDRYGRWYGAGLEDGSYVFVCATEYSELTRTASKGGL